MPIRQYKGMVWGRVLVLLFTDSLNAIHFTQGDTTLCRKELQNEKCKLKIAKA